MWKVKHYLAAIALVAATALFIPVEAFAAVAPAPAQQDTTVTIIPSQYFDEATLIAVATAIAGTLNAIIVKLMGPWGWAAKIARIDQLFFRYIKGGLTKLLEKNPNLAKTGLTVDVKNALIANVANDVLGIIPGWMVRFLGGKDRIEAAIRNRLPDALKDIDIPFLGGAAPK